MSQKSVGECQGLLAPVRAPAENYESGGREFESLRAPVYEAPRVNRTAFARQRRPPAFGENPTLKQNRPNCFANTTHKDSELRRGKRSEA